ncbi:MAG: hypothetical protein LCH76_00740 [Actinobacteria bacterium]|nr:hypothetical protein [Actinomycetota bacterium]
MTSRLAIEPTGRSTSHRPPGGWLRGVLAIALMVVALTAASLPAAADPGPRAPAPLATESPAPQGTDSPAPDPEATSATPTQSTPPTTPRPDPEGDRWVRLAIIGGGSLLGAVVLFMLIGGLIRLRNRRRRYRR